MSVLSTCTLLKLDLQSLLREKGLVIAALQDMPKELFPPVFIEAFTRGNPEVLKAMMLSYPFWCLLWEHWALMHLRTQKSPHSPFEKITAKQRNRRTLEALLEGLDMQLSQKVHHRRWKLQELDWRNVHQDFWTGGPRAMKAAHSSAVSYESHGKPGGTDKQPHLIIFANLRFKRWSSSCATQDKVQLCLLKWVRERKASVHLCCEKVRIHFSDVFIILKHLRAVQLDSIHKLHVLSNWGWDSMKAFVLHVKKMKNLHTLHLLCESPEMFNSFEKNNWYSHICAFHLGQLQNLQEIVMDEVFFLNGTLHKWLRSQTTLQVLSLSCSPLKESDLKHLSQWGSTNQLKSLTLRCISVESFNPETLHVLIDKLAITVETLVLEQCDLTDSQLLAILSALRHCSWIKTFSCYWNHFSLGILQDLLRLSAALRHLSKALYPAPMECYDSNDGGSFVHHDQATQVFAELAYVLEDIRPSLSVLICTYCASCMFFKFYKL
ncbi:PRAME family member 12-like [Octodon degus]|uniref:PRAME family member 12-like n=1 Tax=Octodon degus TaxID=10160 RepID=A0A6P3V8T7_OCTDE|nr:PRAME family member 12-like [Octodon degus]